jgi:hypothetical protein
MIEKEPAQFPSKWDVIVLNNPVSVSVEGISHPTYRAVENKKPIV